MKCHLCGEDKLSEEFPFYAPTENCNHALLHCLKCVTKKIERSNKCSQCGFKVEVHSKRYTEYMETLEFLFPKFVAPNDISSVSIEATSYITIINLTGESITVEYKPDTTIEDVKKEVKKKMKIPLEQQVLLYKGDELKAKYKGGTLRTLACYHVQPNSTIRLLVRLFEVPHELDHVIFDLSWGFPDAGIDYLDATIFIYSGEKLLELVDYDHRKSTLGAVHHSGDEIDDDKKIGRHKINVSIKSLPPDIDTLVFTLSSWNSPNMDHFPNTSLRFFDKNFPNKQLCSDEMEHATSSHSQAIIMCCLAKRKGVWEVHSLKTPSNGNASDYQPLKLRIHRILSRTF